MKTNKLPQSAWSDAQEAGSQSMQTGQSSSYYQNDNSKPRTGYASNDASYHYNSSNDEHPDYLMKNSLMNNRLIKNSALQDSCFDYKCAAKHGTKEHSTKEHGKEKNSTQNLTVKDKGYKKPQKLSNKEPLMSEILGDRTDAFQAHALEKGQRKNVEESDFEQDMDAASTITSSHKAIPERVFMNGLIKHTGIALAIIIPLAAFSAYAATPPMNPASDEVFSSQVSGNKTSTKPLSVNPSSIIYKSANIPTTVDSVDLKKYAGTWYEIGRLPMYFQRNCASDVTANYTEKTDGSGIIVTNKCTDKDGSGIVAEGLAKPADDTGSKLKVTFLPSWIRWLPVGRADYWVLARDSDYKTALVGTPDKKYLWLLARSPNISQQTYAKYRQIAQNQGYDLKEFKLTPQTNQTVSLVP